MKKIIYLLICLSVAVGQTKIGGTTFFDFTSKDENSAFNFVRQYISITGATGENLKYNVVMDVGRINIGDVRVEIDQDSTGNPIYGEQTEDTRLTAFLKKAQIDYSTNFGNLSFGLIGMNTYGVQEKNWGYRFISKSAVDKNKFSSTVDIGIGYSNTLFNDLHLSALLTNGEGYNSPQGDKYHKVSVNATYGERKLNKNDGFNAGVVYSTEGTDNKSINMMSLFGGFAGHGLRIGAEYDMLNDNGEDENVISASANYSISNNLDAFVRYDMFDDNATDENGENFLVTGIIMNCGNGLSVAPNIQMTTFEDSSEEKEMDYKINFQFKF